MRTALGIVATSILVVMALLAACIGVFYFEEDWRGAHDWSRCQQDLKARGESINIHELAAPGQTDLTKFPVFSNDSDVIQQAWAPLVLVISNNYSDHPPKLPSGYKTGQPIDLAAWQAFYWSDPGFGLTGQKGTPAQDVLRALKRAQPVIDQVRTAMKAPDGYWPEDYDQPFNTRSQGRVKLLSLVKFLSLKGTASLANEDADSAASDYLFSFAVNEISPRNRTLLPFLLIAASRSVDDSILWEGIHRHSWSDAQLQQFDAALASEDMLNLSLQALRTERASFLRTAEVVRANQEKYLPMILSVGEPDDLFSVFTALLMHLRPAGWWDEDLKYYSLNMQKLIDSIDLSQRRMEKIVPIQRTLLGSIYLPLSGVAESTNEGEYTKMAEAETNQRLARIACRLERYWLVHRQYPKSLAELGDLPPHLNEEVLTSRPLHYHSEGGSYILYSTSADGKDRGGAPRAIDQFGDDYDWLWLGP